MIEEDLLGEYFDIKNREDLANLSIRKSDSFNCHLIHEKENKAYKWFLLAKSPRGRTYTLCETDFHKDTQEGKYQARLTFRKVDKNLEDRALRSDIAFIRMPFQSWEDGYREFWKMIWFLYGFREVIDTGDFKKSYNIVSTDSYIVEFNNQIDAERVESLRKLLTEGNVTEDDINQALQGKRKATLEEFRKLLTIRGYWRTFDARNWQEAVWHHFLKTHSWILGLNADLKFIRDLVSEQAVGNPNTSWKGNPEADLMGISDYTVLIELKTPETKIFTSDRLKTARANTWSFSQDFIDGISQCLGQKFDWDKNHKNKDLTDGSKKDPKIFDQNIHRTVDPKCVFLIGCKHHEMPEDKNTQDTYTKRDTFQRYRRNSRNIEMLTFDELYERAYFTVYNQKPDMTTLAIVDDETYEVNDFGDPELHELEGEENPDMKLSYDYVPAEETEVPIEDIPF